MKELTEPTEAYTTFTEDVDYNEFDSGNHTGLKDSNGNTVIAPLYAEMSIISNGVALVVYRENDAYYFGLDEEGTGLKATDGFLETYTPRFYAYADLNGNTTFPQSTLDHIAEANRIGEERWKSILSNREVEAEHSREVEEDSKCPEWIEGTWKWSGYINGYNLGCAISFNLETGRYVLNTMDGDTELGTFTYDAYKNIIHCRPNNSSGYSVTYEVDTYNNRISLGDDKYFERVGKQSTSESHSQTNSVYFYTDSDVIAWLSGKRFSCEGTTLQITYQGISIEGRYLTGAPIVTQFSGSNAIIKASPITGGRDFVFRLNATRGTMTEQNGDVWVLRR
ncbi:MAG: hypothetical protein NC548_51985 [Lachnospiraceae bacterium]|nr:hypothetical protein [Lachnospiraceae bacterium]